ncbi:lysozyme g-like [Leptodactylus fuscus]|uniref:lysozyme g-like n=1 Tax=Leptodactylus fuscus TaxID=238119 RepID=UPI003F4E504E
MASRYGVLEQIPTTGASVRTGRQDGNNYSGTFGSEKMAEVDLERMKKYRQKIHSVSSKTGIDSAIIAGIMSRESRAGNALDPSKNGDCGNAFGLMQIDKRYHIPKGAWDSEEHILQGAEILCSMFRAIKQKFPKWTTNQQMKGAIAAYNAGPGRVSNFEDIDSCTTGHDYSNDVVARAKYFKRFGF